MNSDCTLTSPISTHPFVNTATSIYPDMSLAQSNEQGVTYTIRKDGPLPTQPMRFIQTTTNSPTNVQQKTKWNQSLFWVFLYFVIVVVIFFWKWRDVKKFLKRIFSRS
jgi:hypothetical protein